MNDWWLRTALVLRHPRAVFVAIRQSDEEDLTARGEPVLLIVLLAGMAYVLSTPSAAHLMDDPDYDALLVAVWTFLAGGLYGTVGYWLLGGILHLVVRALGSQGTYRRTRHICAFAAVPLVCSLALLPVGLALYGSAIFHRGGPDAGTGGRILGAFDVAFALWAAGLLVVGVRAVHGWTWGRASLAAAGPLALCVAFVLF